MARIIVTTDRVDERHTPPALGEETPVLLDERVESVHLCDEHAAGQLIERLAWAISDAEQFEHV